MGKRILVLVVLAGLLAFSACDALPTATAPGPSDAEVATLVALATQAAAEPVVVLPTDTPVPVIEPTPTRTAAPGSITITSIIETAPGKAIVSWDAIGDFPAGYKVVWTDVQGLPTFPEDTNVYTSDPNARSAMISGTVGKIYYVRVCRYTGDKCDIYSTLGIFAYKMTALTPRPTITLRPIDATATKIAAQTTLKPTTVSGGGGGGSSGSYIVILEMKGGEDGKPYMKWESGYKPSAGFKIVYSTTNKTPTYGSDPYFYVPGGGTTEAWVDATQGLTYYYRVCGWNGTKCEVYSPMFTYKVPGTPSEPTPAFTATPDPATINLYPIDNGGLGAASATWAVSGTFPNGYKVLYSKTNPTPTLSDSYVYISNEAIHTAMIPDLQPGQLYYFRVCKYYGSACVVYSNVQTYTVPAATTETDFTVIMESHEFGLTEISWVIPLPVSTQGYKVLMTAGTGPVPDTAYVAHIADPATLSYIDSTSGPGTFSYKICRWSGSWCLSYSNTITFDIDITPPLP